MVGRLVEWWRGGMVVWCGGVVVWWCAVGEGLLGSWVRDNSISHCWFPTTSSELRDWLKVIYDEVGWIGIGCYVTVTPHRLVSDFESSSTVTTVSHFVLSSKDPRP